MWKTKAAVVCLFNSIGYGYLHETCSSRSIEINDAQQEAIIQPSSINLPHMVAPHGNGSCLFKSVGRAVAPWCHNITAVSKTDHGSKQASFDVVVPPREFEDITDVTSTIEKAVAEVFV